MIEKKSESLFEIDEERTEQIENAKKALLKTASTLSDELSNIVKDSIKAMEDEYNPERWR